MARAKLGSLFSDISGSIGGLICQRGNSGSILRTKSKKVVKRTSLTQFPRVYAGYLAQFWHDFSDSNRQTWQTFADFVALPQNHNPGFFLNGMQLFYSINHYRLLYGYAIISTPVFDKTLPQSVDCSFDLVSDELTFQPGRMLGNSEEKVYIYATFPLRPGCNNFENKFKLMKFSTPSFSYININDAYLTAFGYQPVVGDILGFKITLSSAVTGLLQPWQRARIIIQNH